ncbi:hypothetical protein J3R30DRAFT_3294806, partial [Lentinula aciculospora]
GGGDRYPYPKSVWSPAGGWWVRPSNWKSNTFIVATGIAGICYMVHRVSASKEHRYNTPTKDIPSSLVRQFFTFSENPAQRVILTREVGAAAPGREERLVMKTLLPVLLLDVTE